MTKKNIKEGTCEIIESIPGETILQFFSRVFGVTYDETMREIDKKFPIIKNYHELDKDFISQNKEAPTMDEYYPQGFPDNTIIKLPKFEPLFLSKTDKNFINGNKEIRSTIAKTYGIPPLVSIKNCKKWCILISIDGEPIKIKSFIRWDIMYPFSFDTREEARIMLKALKIWNPGKYKNSIISKCY